MRTKIIAVESSRYRHTFVHVVVSGLIAAAWGCDSSKAPSSSSSPGPTRSTPSPVRTPDDAARPTTEVDANTRSATSSGGDAGQVTGTQLAVYRDPACASATRSPGSSSRATLELWNAFDGRMRVDWVDFKGGYRDSGEVPPLGVWKTGSFDGHVFRVVPPNGKAFKVCASGARPVLVIAADGSVRVASRAKAKRVLIGVRDRRYTRRMVGTTPLWVHKRLANSARQVAVVTQRLIEAAKLLGGQFKLAASVPLWLEPTYPHKGGDARYHPPSTGPATSATSPKTNAVEVVDVQRFLRDSGASMPLGILHEYVHAIHYHLPATVRTEIQQLYKAAVKGGRYNSVRHGNRGGLKAYALSTEFEYFAEISEAYLGTNDWYPFWREQLAKHDPAGFALAQRLWGKTGYRAGLAAKPCASNTRSSTGGAFTSILWKNSSSALVTLSRVHGNGRRSVWRTLAPGASAIMETTRGDVVSVLRARQCIGLYTATRAPSRVTLK